MLRQRASRIILFALLAGHAATGASDHSQKTKQLEWEPLHLPTNARTLPLKVVTIVSTESASAVDGGQHLADIDADGYDEFYYYYNDHIDSAYYVTGLVAEPHSISEGRPVQHNGPFLNCRIWKASAIDIVGSSGKDIVLTRQFQDSVFFDVVSYRVVDGLLTIDTTLQFPVAVARAFPPRQYWHDIHVSPLAALDLNRDGVKDLVYSRSAKPDSAIERGLVAYDLANHRQLWFFPLADLVGLGNLRVYTDADGDSCMVFVVTSTANRYSANGMTSTEAYAVGLDLNGQELWRQTIGGSMFYPGLSDVAAGDGTIARPVVTCDPTYPNRSDTILRVFEPWTGQVIAAFATDFRDGNVSVIEVHSLSPDLFVQWRTDTAFFACRLGTDLIPQRRWACSRRRGAAFWIRQTFDTCVYGSMEGERELLLNRDMEPMAAFSYMPTSVDIGHARSDLRILASQGYRNYMMVGLEVQSHWMRLYARFQYAFLFLGSLLGLTTLWQAINRFRLWRQAALGVPTLSSIKAMVLLLDRSGRLLYANKHRLTDVLVGRWRRRSHFQKTGLAKHAELVDAISQSFETSLGMHQQRVEFDKEGQTSNTLEVSIYPYVDQYNSFRGKIVVVEELEDTAVRNWKVVLGESAQNWMHRLKHHFGTIRLISGNLLSDRVIAQRLEQSPDLQEQRMALDLEVLEGSEAAAKILKYLKNPPPRAATCDVITLLQLVVSAKRQAWRPEVDVSFSQQCELPLIVADPDQLREVFANLLSNAYQALNEHGAIRISVQLAGELQKGGGTRTVEVKIEDNGVGISGDDLPHVFEPNFTKSPGGTGIGLALVREIVANHHGDVTIESQVGQGTTVTVSLPVTTAEER